MHRITAVIVIFPLVLLGCEFAEIAEIGSAEDIGTADAAMIAEEEATIVEEAGLTEEAAMLRSRIPASISASELNFRTVRLSSESSSQPQLYVEASGRNVMLVDVIDSRTIRTFSGRVVTLPGELYTFTPGLVRMRVGPSTSAGILTNLRAGEVVLVLDRIGD